MSGAGFQRGGGSGGGGDDGGKTKTCMVHLQLHEAWVMTRRAVVRQNAVKIIPSEPKLLLKR